MNFNLKDFIFYKFIKEHINFLVIHKMTIIARPVKGGRVKDSFNIVIERLSLHFRPNLLIAPN